MIKMMRVPEARLSALIFLFCVSSVHGYAQDRLPAFEMNSRLARGINIGNAFEAPSETAWGNPWRPEYFEMIAELGFQHVRLPVRWEPADRSTTGPPYTINPAFLDRIQEVVDEALKNKLHIIVNMHHHEALYADPEGERARFLAQWQQIAERFKNYPDSLLFEVLNEPHGSITPARWNELFAGALAEIRKTNSTRVVLMGTAEYGGLSAVAQLNLPDDDYLILSPHYYNPFPFTHQGADWVDGSNAWLGTEWRDTEAERAVVKSEFSYLLYFSKHYQVPIHVGEFGAFSRADTASRKRWTNFLARWLEKENMSWAYWEFSAGFGIYEPASGRFNEYLINSLPHDQLAAPSPVTLKSVYHSNFSAGADGWTLTQQGGAAGTLNTNSGELHISVSRTGTEPWHLQLTKNNIRLEQGKQYKVSFTAKAGGEKGISFYGAMSKAPWSGYGSSASFTLTPEEREYTLVLNMTAPTDAAARLVFDLGKDTTGVLISDVTIEEMLDLVTGLKESGENTKVISYPNPVSSKLTIEGLSTYRRAELTNVRGSVIAQFDIGPGMEHLNLPEAPPGIYFLILSGDKKRDLIKLVKE